MNYFYILVATRAMHGVGTSLALQESVGIRRWAGSLESRYTLWLVEEVGMTVPEAVEVDSLQHSKFACNSGSHID